MCLSFAAVAKWRITDYSVFICSLLTSDTRLKRKFCFLKESFALAPIDVIPGGGGSRRGWGFLHFVQNFCQKTLPRDNAFCQKTQKSQPKYDVYNKNNQLLFTSHILIDELMLKIEADVWN